MATIISQLLILCQVYSEQISNRLFYNATRTDIEKRLNDFSPNVRIYAAYALFCKYPNIDFFPLVLAHINDRAIVRMHNVDVVYNQTVADFMIEMIRPRLPESQHIQRVCQFFSWG